MSSSQLIHPHAERVLRQIILKDLINRGRPDWDKPHTEAVVTWMKFLLTKLDQSNLDSSVMITAAYAHDWGYGGLFAQTRPVTINQSRSQKKLHMNRGAVLIERLLHQRLTSYFTQQQILRIVHLVSVHDDLRSLTDEDEILLMECDTLGMLDVERVTPTLSPLDNRILISSIKRKRLPKFQHQLAQEIADQLLITREKWFAQASQAA